MQMPEQDSLQATYPLKTKFSFPVGGIRTTPVRVSKYECVCVCVRERESVCVCERERMCVCVLDLYVCLFSTPFHLPCFCCSFLFTFGGRRALSFHAQVPELFPVRLPPHMLGQ